LPPKAPWPDGAPLSSTAAAAAKRAANKAASIARATEHAAQLSKQKAKDLALMEERARLLHIADAIVGKGRM